MALGAWGAVQATGAGLGVAVGGALRDVVSHLATGGALGPVLATPVTGYSAVYHLEMLLLFMALVAIGPLVRMRPRPATQGPPAFGLADLPG
jgi:BCD family chlorophyll transporter-like MFS transporter